MVLPEELRLIDTLTDEDEFEPEIADNGAVSYPEVTRLLDDANSDPAAVLEHFTSRGVLMSEFVSKVYICPECTTEGMQYTTVCPVCEDEHAIQTIVFKHGCGYVGPSEEFEDGRDYRCRNCELRLQFEDIDETQRYVCNECGEVFDTPDDRLWCRECVCMLPPLKTIEQALYRYSLTPDGKRWLDRHKDARQAVAEALQERRFETEIDATITNESESRLVHVLAEDTLMDERRLVAIYETPNIESVNAFCAFANSVEAHPIVITTSGIVEDDVAAHAEDSELTLLAFKGDEMLEAAYETVESATTHQQGFFQRLTAAIEVPGRKGQ
jgi:hypothetical protein